MTRPRSGPPERPGPLRRRSSFPLIALVVIVAIGGIVSACIGGEAVSTPTTAVPSAASLSPSTASAPSASASPVAPSATPEPTPSSGTTSTATPTSTEDPSATEATADACTGSEENQAFFAESAARFPWPVYCAVLPARWSVGRGSFSGAGGGSLDISYNGPGGGTLSLHQGASCGSGGVCQENGTDAGDAPFGDQTGTFVQLDDGGWMIVVDRSANPSWAVIGNGMDEATFRTFAADLARLD